MTSFGVINLSVYLPSEKKRSLSDPEEGVADKILSSPRHAQEAGPGPEGAGPDLSGEPPLTSELTGENNNSNVITSNNSNSSNNYNNSGEFVFFITKMKFLLE